ncbi:Z-ring associated protein ZapG [Vibrio ostreicida]|uniref:Z-ring associated protein G n=1 Tax=Vibrio ostreicida TaxID=526588 RepID=A0ABT8BR20_9VIBR|nr:Z-ring associated protein ZapG [Vibrio ostreicida]MDN3609148.1 Z-ring associated protein ZapG [Vibrio ostreicida]NPD08041.1 DUF1043 family protein [Vibrio ostreicida]
MPWIYALVGLLVGAGLGVVISRVTTPGYKKNQSIHKELATAKFELEQQKQDLADHFAQTAEMLDSLGREYTKLYQHMAKTSSELLPNTPEQDNPFSKRVSQQSHTSDVKHVEEIPPLNQAPKDYVAGESPSPTEERNTSTETDPTQSTQAT